MFAFHDTRGAIDVAFTDRHGGISGGPYASLNLGGRGDDRDAVEENIDIVSYAFGRGYEATTDDEMFDWPEDRPMARVMLMRQVHGSDVGLFGLVEEEYPAAPGDPPTIEADALVTRKAGLILMVRAADCVPVLLADVDRRVVGAAHAGRPGMVAGIVPNTVRAMRAIGAEQLVAWVGPHVCGACYEVPEEMRAEVATAVPESRAETSWGTPAVDIGAGVRAQLARDDVEIVDSARCTMEDEDMFSYRRQGARSGRNAGMIWVRE